MGAGADSGAAATNRTTTVKPARIIARKIFMRQKNVGENSNHSSGFAGFSAGLTPRIARRANRRQPRPTGQVAFPQPASQPREQPPAVPEEVRADEFAEMDSPFRKLAEQQVLAKVVSAPSFFILPTPGYSNQDGRKCIPCSNYDALNIQNKPVKIVTRSRQTIKKLLIRSDYDA